MSTFRDSELEHKYCARDVSPCSEGHARVRKGMCDNTTREPKRSRPKRGQRLSKLHSSQIGLYGLYMFTGTHRIQVFTNKLVFKYIYIHIIIYIYINQTRGAEPVRHLINPPMLIMPCGVTAVASAASFMSSLTDCR
jgi:hypothetical protein